MYCSDLEKRLNRYEEYWNHENHDRPLLSIYAPKIKGTTMYPEVPFEGTMEQRWWDTQYIIKRARASMEATYFAGEAFPAICPNLGPDVFAAFLGTQIVYERDTSYAVPFVTDWSAFHPKFDENNLYWKKIEEMTQTMLEDSKGDYLVGVTDLHGGMDALVAMRGPENVCMDLYDSPEEVKRVLGEVQDIFEVVMKRSFELFYGKQKGTTNWMGLYHPGDWYVSSSDFIYMISPEIFDEFSKESIRREAKIIGNNIYHLDGIGSKRHLDKLLEMPEIHGIQWVYAPCEKASDWIDLLKQVQSAGKLIEITCFPEDMPVLFQCGLAPEGVHYTIRNAESPEHAEQIICQANETYHKVQITV